MADTRRANPHDQLEVDIMTIDYVVYNAIRTKAKALKIGTSGRSDRDGLHEAADRLIEIFDVLIRLFRQNHPATDLSNGTTYNIKILEFLIILHQALHNTPCSASFQREREFNTTYRRRWLASWANDPTGPGSDIKAYIDTDTPQGPIDGNIGFSDLLVRFMDLSAEIADCMGFVSGSWYKLAVEMMTRAAVGRQSSISSETLRAVDIRALTTWVSECFAWGIIHPCPSVDFPQAEDDEWIAQRVREQVYIRDVFLPRGRGNARNGDGHADGDGDTTMSDAAPDSATSTSNTNGDGDTELREDPTWTALRNEYHTKLIRLVKIAHNDTPSFQSGYISALGDLYKGFGHTDFVLRLCEYIEGLWCLNMDNISGKPVLVQMEEGGIEGVNDDEFGMLLDRVGLKVRMNNNVVDGASVKGQNGNEDGVMNGNRVGVLRWAR